MAKRWNFEEAEKRFQKSKSDLPKSLGNIQLRHFKKSFKDEGFTDATLQKWPGRDRPTRRDRETGRRRSILTQTRNLRRSIRTRSASFREIRTGSYGIPYARPHNRGIDPQKKRQFIGNSRVMTKRIRNRILRELRTVFK